MGKNLQDHAVVSIPFTLNMSSAIEIKKSFTFEALFNQMFTGKGEHCYQYRFKSCPEKMVIANGLYYGHYTLFIWDVAMFQ